MCYAKPGPRCASSAFKRLVRISKSEDGEFTYEQREEAVFDYYSTPAGMSLITVREQQGMDTTDIPMSGFSSMNTSELKKMLEAYRSRKMSAVKAMPSTDTVSHHNSGLSLNDVSGDFEDDDTPRAFNDDIHSAYIDEASDFVSRIPDKGFVPLRWLTSDGSGVMNAYLVGGMEEVDKKFWNRTLDSNDEHARTGLYSEENIADTIATLSDLIQENKREKAVVTYRGVKEDYFAVDEDSLDDDDARLDLVRSRFHEGDTMEMKNFSSTSASPKVADSFAWSNVVFEMKTRSCIPLGGVSNWGFREYEMLVDKGTRFKVVGVKQVKFEGASEPVTRTVVQMEEV